MDAIAVGWLARALFGGALLLCVVGNWTLIGGWVRGRSSSLVPLVGGLLGTGGGLVVPVARVRAWSWLAIALDPSWWLVVGALVELAYDRLRRSLPR